MMRLRGSVDATHVIVGKARLAGKLKGNGNGV